MSARRPHHRHKAALDKSNRGEPLFVTAWGGECVNLSPIKHRTRGQKIDSVLGDIVQTFIFVPFKHGTIWTLFVSIVKKKVGDATGGLPPLAKCRGKDASGVLDVNHLRPAYF